MVDVSDDSDTLRTSKVVVVCTQIENLMYLTDYILCEVSYYKKIPLKLVCPSNKTIYKPCSCG